MTGDTIRSAQTYYGWMVRPGSRIVPRRDGRLVTGVELSQELSINESRNIIIWGVRAGTAAAGRTLADELADPQNARLWEHEVGHKLITDRVLESFNRFHHAGAFYPFDAPLARNDTAGYRAASTQLLVNIERETTYRIEVTQTLYETITQELRGAESSVGPDRDGVIRYVFGLGVSMRQVQSIAHSIFNNFLQLPFDDALARGIVGTPPSIGQRLPNQTSPTFAERLESARAHSLAYVQWEFGHLHDGGYSDVPQGYRAPAGAPSGFGVRPRW